MEKVLEIIFVFIFASTIGWIMELCYRSFRAKKLVNPGFMIGCTVPIYGIGGSGLYLMCSLNIFNIENKMLYVIILMLSATILMTLIEFIFGFISLKYFHNRLWDYSDRWGNVQGLICPLFSAIWGGCCLIFYYLIYPWLSILAVDVSSSIPVILFMGIYIGIFSVDLGYSIDLFGRLRTYAKKFKEVINFENFKAKARESKRKFVFITRLHSTLTSYLDKLHKEKDNN